MPVSTYSLQIAGFGAMLADGTLDNAKLALFSNNLDLSKETVFGDLDIVTQTGMDVFGPIVWIGPFINGAGDVVIVGTSHSFVASGSVADPFTVYGWAILNEDGDTLRYAELLENPVAIEEIGHGLVVTPTIPWGV